MADHREIPENSPEANLVPSYKDTRRQSRNNTKHRPTLLEQMIEHDLSSRVSVWQRVTFFLESRPTTDEQRACIEREMTTFTNSFRTLLDDRDNSRQSVLIANSACIEAFNLGLLIADPSLVKNDVRSIAQELKSSISKGGQKGGRIRADQQAKGQQAWQAIALRKANEILERHPSKTMTYLAAQIGCNTIGGVQMPQVGWVYKYFIICKRDRSLKVKDRKAAY